MKAFYKDIGLGVLCKLVGKTRKAFYDNRDRKEKAKIENKRSRKEDK